MKKLYLCLIIFDLFMGTIIWLPHFDLFNLRIFIDNTSSMLPTIKPGSVVIVQKTGTYKKGDIVTFKSDPISTTHRIFKIINRDGKDFLITKGDNNNAFDNDQTPAENIIGKVILIIPYLGVLLTFLKTKLGLSLLIFLPSAIIILVELKKIILDLTNQMGHNKI